MVLRHQCLLLGRNSALALLLLLIAGCGDPTATSPAPEPTPDTANFDCERLDCDDGVVCTLDSCSAEVGCEHAPRDADCDDGVSCTDDSCDVEEGCVFAPQVGLCDDGIDCTVDVCDVETGCDHVADPRQCAEGQLCRPGDGGCIDPPPCDGVDDPRCDDGQDCTADRCDLETGQCVYAADHGACSDGRFCNGEEQCGPFVGCVQSFGPACDDGLVCTVDRCDEDADRCERTPDDRLCSDGVFCNGAEVCSLEDKQCIPGVAPTCDDGADCTADLCDAELDACINTPDDAACDDAMWCNGAERCLVREGCVDGVAPDCDDDDVCTLDICDEENDRCVHPIPEEICNGEDDDCDGEVDEGVQSPCGDCDVTCLGERIGAFGRDWDADRLDGAHVDDERGGVVISVSIRENDWLWIPNTSNSTLSRWDPETVSEVARYRVGLPEGECPGICCHEDGCNQPSRVAIDGRGDVYVANRGFAMQGTVTKVAGALEDCVDRNENGLIDTSSGDEALDYGEDECVLFTVPVDRIDAILRSLTVDAGDEDHPQGYPWVGGYNSRRWHKLNPSTGAVVVAIDVDMSPYSGGVTSDGLLWSAPIADDRLISIDTRTYEVSEPIPVPPQGRVCTHQNHAYGIAVDARDRIWLPGSHCRDVMGYDPSLQAWTRIDLAARGLAVARGVSVDTQGRVWALAGYDSPNPGVYIWEADAFVPGGNLTEFGFLQFPSQVRGPSGVGFGSNGDVWALFYLSSHLMRINPRTLQMTVFTGPEQPYTYSDFTGSVRRGVFGAGRYEDLIDAGCAEPNWRDLRWNTEVPDGGRVALTFTTASSVEELDNRPIAGPILVPGAQSPLNMDEPLVRAGLGHDRYLRVGATLDQNPDGESPVLRYLQATWSCP
jgi:streptogramin lyase